MVSKKSHEDQDNIQTYDGTITWGNKQSKHGPESSVINKHGTNVEWMCKSETSR